MKRDISVTTECIFAKLYRYVEIIHLERRISQIVNLCLILDVPSVGGAAVYAGRPGKCRKKPAGGAGSGGGATSGGLVDDWHRCVKHLSVSSRESQAHKLIDSSGGYWQSSGSQGKVSSTRDTFCWNVNFVNEYLILFDAHELKFEQDHVLASFTKLRF